jgi:uncharacterized protein (TIGR00369 family)
MRIWKVEDHIDNMKIAEMLNERGKNTMSDFLGVEFVEVGDNYLSARMPVNQKTKQPAGIMHGGASCMLAESVGSTGANLCVDRDHFYCVGLDINTNHIRSVREGHVLAIARPFHLGKKTQVWGIEIYDDGDHLVSVTRLTMAVLPRKRER